MTVGPLVLLFLLGVTFYVGAGPEESSDISSHSLTTTSERRRPQSAEVLANMGTDASVRGRRDESPPVTLDPRGRGILNPQNSFRRIAGAGRRDGSNAEQVGGWCMRGGQ